MSAGFRDVPEIHLLHVQAPIPIGRVQAHVGKETLHAYYLEEGQEHLAEARKNWMQPGALIRRTFMSASRRK